MSNKSVNSPINISPQSITGKCDLKCAYNFDYPTTNLVATNNGTNITIDDAIRGMKREMALINAKEGRVRTLGGNY
jgi:hypothetical protein